MTTSAEHTPKRAQPSNAAEDASTGAGKKTKNAAKVQTSLLSHFARTKASQPATAPIQSSPIKQQPPSSDDPAAKGGDTATSETSEAAPASQPELGLALAPARQLDVPAAPRPLTEEEERLFALELMHLPDSWLRHLRAEFSKAYFRQLKEFLRGEGQKNAKIFPPAELIYSWAAFTPLDKTKVVIIGQDPYHNDRQAMGLCFSVPRGVAVPPSLLNIYKELAEDIAGFEPPGHGDLTRWAQQGVLLLNTSLTVRAHEPASHAGKGWEQFTDAVIAAVNRHNSNVVFILWGNHAQRKAAMIDKVRPDCLAPSRPRKNTWSSLASIRRR